MIDTLVKGADVKLELAKYQGRDALLTNSRWGVRDTSANWSTHVFPGMEDFRKNTILDIAARAAEDYGITGANQCAHMISEFSSHWMTPDEEEAFTAQWNAVSDYANYIDFAAGVGGRRHQFHDFSMSTRWVKHSDLFPRLPKFRVGTDVEGITGKRPSRTGVYVPQDDALGTLQFAWTGNDDGVLGEVQTMNDLGRQAVAAIGRDAMWVDKSRMAAYATGLFGSGTLTDRGGFSPGDESDPEYAGMILSKAFRTSRPSKWYFIEMIDGEFDDTASDPVDPTMSAQGKLI